MTIRPIEFQVSIPKTFDASKEQQNFLKRSDIVAQQNALSSKELASKKMNSVNDTEKTEKKDIKNDSEEKNQSKNRNKQNKNKEEKTIKEDHSFCFDPGKIDIKI